MFIRIVPRPSLVSAWILAAALAMTAAEGQQPGQWTVKRVAGQPAAEVKVEERDGEKTYRAGRAYISSPLAKGYPAPTAPGAIELKRYGSVRQAKVVTRGGENNAFWPLFQHIKSRQIAMTAPVVMTGDMAGEDGQVSSMAFLYRAPELGPTGPAEMDVVVEDTTTTTVLSIGFLGGRRAGRFEQLRAQLEDWLKKQRGSGRWKATGESARLLGYNGPDTPYDQRWWELQLPVRWQRSY